MSISVLITSITAPLHEAQVNSKTKALTNVCSGGPDADLYVAVTASSGTPTYQYGLNVLMTKPDRHQAINVREGTTG